MKRYALSIVVCVSSTFAAEPAPVKATIANSEPEYTYAQPKPAPSAPRATSTTQAAPAATGPDFRTVSWGMSREQVKASEAGLTPKSEDDDSITFQTKIGTDSVLLMYSFIEGKLYRGSYALYENYNEPMQYVVKFSEWEENVKAKYGKAEPEYDWLNTLYQDEGYNGYGKAIRYGHLTIQFKHDTKRTLVWNRATGSNRNIVVLLNYISKDLLPLAQKAQAQAASKAF